MQVVRGASILRYNVGISTRFRLTSTTKRSRTTYEKEGATRVWVAGSAKGDADLKLCYLNVNMNIHTYNQLV
jgi:hypothetical protein